MAASVSTAVPAPVAGRVVDGALGRWFAEAGERTYTRARRIPLDALEGWHTDAHTGDLVHDRGSFFSVGGLDVTAPDGPVPRWAQPVLHQPETGILGLLVKDFGGVPHYLMQAKPEPGNAGASSSPPPCRPPAPISPVRTAGCPCPTCVTSAARRRVR